MQVLHPTSGGLYTGITNAVSTIYRIEGWRTLWKGVSSVIVGAGMFIHNAWRKWEMANFWQVLPTLSISVHMRRSRSLRVEMKRVIIHLLLVIFFSSDVMEEDTDICSFERCVRHYRQ